MSSYNYKNRGRLIRIFFEINPEIQEKVMKLIFKNLADTLASHISASKENNFKKRVKYTFRCPFQDK